MAPLVCISTLLDKTGLLDPKSLNSPMVSNKVLCKSNGTHLLDVFMYRSVLGAFHYCSMTRPDIASTISQLWQFMVAPIDLH